MSETTAHEDEYDDALVAMLELVWGEGFLSPGGPAAVRQIVKGVDLAGKRVLDIGRGLGGIDIQLARECGCRVIGLDIEAPLVERARANVAAASLAERVDLRVVEPGPLRLDDASFDAVFGKDSWIHIDDKPAFFAEIYRVLTPGGLLLAGDWCRGPEPYSKDMAYFFELEGLTYNMDTLDNHGRALAARGLVDLKLEDISDWYRGEAKAEYERMKGPLYPRMADILGPEKADHFVENWRLLTVVLDGGELRPGRLRARKPH